MKKLKIYIDTSVISHLDAIDVQDKMQDTIKLWEEVRNGEYQAIISDITFQELSKCPEPKQSYLVEQINRIDFIREEEVEESEVLVDKYLHYGVLREKSRDDLRHIALATVLRCNCIISWNFKHFVNLKVINKVRVVNIIEGYSEINILPPSMLIGGNENDD